MSLRIINKQNYLIIASAIIFFLFADSARYLTITIGLLVTVNDISHRIIAKLGMNEHNDCHSLLQKSSHDSACTTFNLQFLSHCELYLTFNFAQKYKKFISELKLLRIV
ncbi:hypothetical protein A9G24_06995 [Gilliamella sp. App6-5]|uniref:hypothetical protein n=1 Tax=Gilliamella sp. App6-5 TaxID=3120232 RepID=UPI00080E4FB9|nr:hypothetical protein [Gilliamella apicola]OCG13849.1 hypothetical protein A9G24_06995 [Gilliamella apicola]